MQLTWSTEQRNPRTLEIDTLDASGRVDLILAEDALVVPAVQRVAGAIAQAVDLAVATLAAGGRVHYVGAGTSGRLAVLDAVELFPTYGVGDDMVIAHLAGGLDAMLHAVEGAEDDAEEGARIVADAGSHDLVVGIAASGRTPYVRGALEAARARGLRRVLISSNTAAPLADLADVAILPDTGPEAITGSTRMKAATAQKIILNTLSTATMVGLGKTYSNLMVDVVATNEKLRHRMVHIVAEATGADIATCQAALASSEGNVAVACVMLLAGVDAAAASAALRDHPRVREALASLRR